RHSRNTVASETPWNIALLPPPDQSGPGNNRQQSSTVHNRRAVDDIPFDGPGRPPSNPGDAGNSARTGMEIFPVSVN
ncbi:MAG TPA: hypothetical protein VMW70_13800, partial [Burkholderiales bacterium]|nr:hypothetical protein [Burkholderiales bacterium]